MRNQDQQIPSEFNDGIYNNPRQSQRQSSTTPKPMRYAQPPAQQYQLQPQVAPGYAVYYPATLPSPNQLPVGPWPQYIVPAQQQTQPFIYGTLNQQTGFIQQDYGQHQQSIPVQQEHYSPLGREDVGYFPHETEYLAQSSSALPSLGQPIYQQQPSQGRRNFSFAQVPVNIQGQQSGPIAPTYFSKPQDKNSVSLNKASAPPYAIATTNNNQQSNTNRIRTDDQNVLAPKKSANGRNSRRRHRNSHLGCATCKSRRIKCDEQLPECRNCVRTRLTCAYLSLGEAAREALKVAQKAHANRLEALDMQASQREAQKNQQHFYPYYNQGLPSRIFIPPPPPAPQQGPYVQHLKIDLQHSVLPQYQPPHEQATQDGSPILHVGSAFFKSSTPSASSTPTTIRAERKHSPQQNVKVTKEQKEPRESQFAIQSDSFRSLAKLLKEHEDVCPDLDMLSEFDNEYTEITLDPKCTKKLNSYWMESASELITQELKLSSESLYKVFDLFQSQLIKEAFNNIVLFKALISQGAAPIAEHSQRVDIRNRAKNVIGRDLEITLRFLNKFCIRYTRDYSDLRAFYDNVSLSFSKFQIFQMSFPSIFYGEHSLEDICKFINIFFDFASNYLNNEFQVFLSEDIPMNVRRNKIFRRAEVLNDHMHLFIIYYVASIRSYHIRPYTTDFMDEYLHNLKDLKDLIYDKLNDTYKIHMNNLIQFISSSVDYWNAVKDGAETNRIQVIFYSLKKFIAICPDESFIGCISPFEEQMIHLYYQAVMHSLKAIYAECSFFFLHSFNGRDGYRYSDALVAALQGNKYTDEQKTQMEYPVHLMKFFRQRNFLIAQYLRTVSQFPAKIMLDDNNKQILMNLVEEEHVTSFKQPLREENYPHIDQTSSFYDRETNSIMIPSVSNTDSFCNFDAAQLKRHELLKKASETDLTEIDKTLLDAFYPREIPSGTELQGYESSYTDET